MSKTELALEELGGEGKRLRQKVIGPRLTPFVRAAFERFDTSARALVAEQVAGALRTLRDAELKAAISTSDLLGWTASALLRADPLPASRSLEPTHEGYRALRDEEQRIPLAVTLAETCLRLLDDGSGSLPKPGDLVISIRAQLAKLDDLKQRVVERDIARIVRPIELLERWWQAPQRSRPTPATRSDGEPAAAGSRRSARAVRQRRCGPPAASQALGVAPPPCFSS